MKKFLCVLSLIAIFVCTVGAAMAAEIRVGHVLNPDHPWNIALSGLGACRNKAIKS
jgi:TRAP-type C4-dicarboxylate transport system substrate-binding protein